MMKPKPGASSSSAPKRNDAFTIPDPAWPSESVVTEILLSLIPNASSAQQIRTTPSAEAKTDYFKVIVAVATNAWRARNEILDPRTGCARDGMQGLAAHIDAIYQNLDAFGIVICDHTGLAYDAGQSLDVVESRPTAGLNQTFVMETVLPSIFWNNRLIQNGQVKIATPLSDATVLPSHGAASPT